jgi:hypothetical protein
MTLHAPTALSGAHVAVLELIIICDKVGRWKCVHRMPNVCEIVPDVFQEMDDELIGR